MTGVSSLKEEVVAGGFNLLVVRELTGGIYFANPKRARVNDQPGRDIVITGVPSRDFPKIQAMELKSSTVCMNFAGIAIFSSEVEEQVEFFIPRVGLVTIAMCMRNMLRLYNSYQGNGFESYAK